MNQKEREFKDSILNKIKTYEIKDKKIPVTINMCLKHATNKFVTTRYYDGREEIIDIGIEMYLCKCSPFYFISEYCSFTLPGTGELSAKSLYYYQREILKDFINWKRVVLTKSRQTGLSTLMALIFFWKIIFFKKEWGVIISKDATSSADVLDKIKENLKNIPFWLGVKVERNNEKSLRFSNGSKIQSFARSKSSGRGTSPTILLLDEFAFYQTKSIAEGIISSVVPSVTATGGSIYVVSTPNGTTGEGELYYRQVQDLRNNGGKNEFEGAVLYDVQWWMCPDKIREGGGPYKGYNDKLEYYEKNDFWNQPSVKKEAEEFFRPIAEKPKENPWLSFQFSQSGEVKYRQEILQDFVVMGNSVFSASTIERMIKFSKEPIAEGDLGSRYYKGLWYWKKPEKGHRYGMGCLPPGEKVCTKDGLKNIEEITLQDKLISKDGEYINIINKQEYDCNESIYDIKPAGIIYSTKFTGEHPILSCPHMVKRKHGQPRYVDYNFKFEKASKIKEGDWLIYPNVYRKNSLTTEEILSYWNFDDLTRKDFKIPKEILLDKDFWWYVGIWLAEGWTYSTNRHYTITTVHNFSTEVWIAKKIEEIFKKYNRKVLRIEKEKTNSLEVVFSSKEIAYFLDKNFGKYAKNKQIPEWVKRLPESFKIELLKGYWIGDGSTFISKGRKQYSTKFVSVSKKLLSDIQDILFSIGIISNETITSKENQKFIKDRECHCLEKYQLTTSNFYSMKLMDIFNVKYDKKLSNKRKIHISNNCFSDDLNYIYLRVEKINKEHYKGKVYNFETEGHTFLCKYFSTHNCDVAKGTADDSTAINVFDLDTDEQVAEYLGRCSTKEAGRLLNDLGHYYNDAYIVVECNSIGEAVFNDLYYNYCYPNMYKMQKINKHDRTKVWTGWMTTTKTRDLITDNFIDIIGDDEVSREYGIYSTRLIDQCKTWVWAGGRPDHTEGSHDDDVFSLAILLYNLPRIKSYMPVEGTKRATFISEDGRQISVEKDEEKYYDTHEVRDRQGYIDTENEMKKLTGVPDNYDEDPLEIYRWLLS